MQSEYCGYLLEGATDSKSFLYEVTPRSAHLLGGPAAFGCSFTFGIGVEEGQDWPSLLGVYNSGKPGSSNDRLVRLAVDYIFKYQPSEIFVLWTLPERREWLDDTGVLKKFNPATSKTDQASAHWHKSHVLLSNEHADAYNLDRNRLLLNSVCELNNVDIFELDISDLVKRMREFSLGSDVSHPGADWHVYMADAFRQIKLNNIENQGNTNDQLC